MFRIKRLKVGLALAGVLLLVVAFAPWIGKTAAQTPPSTASSLAIPYTATLFDEEGNPIVEGLYDFRFAIYDAETGGNLLWSETQEQVLVREGAVSILLGSVVAIPDQLFEGQALWLAVEVRGPGEGTYTSMNPRQQLSASTPSVEDNPTQANSLSCEHTHLGEVWTGSALVGLLVETPSGNLGGAVFGKTGGLGYGVFGQQQVSLSTTGAGVAGFSNSSSGYGGYFNNTGGGIGVVAESNTNFAMFAAGKDDSFYDKYGDLWVAGDKGEIFAGRSLDLYSNGDIYLDLDDDNNDSSACLYIYNGNDSIVGKTCEDGTKSAVLQTENHGQRAVYVIESPEVWLQDFGTAILLNGQATVTFEPIFAQTINPQMDYHVQLTPLCQKPLLLFVVAKTQVGFTVKGVGLDGNPSNCSFDYMIIAKRLGVEELRLEQVLSEK